MPTTRHAARMRLLRVCAPLILLALLTACHRGDLGHAVISSVTPASADVNTRDIMRVDGANFFLVIDPDFPTLRLEVCGAPATVIRADDGRPAAVQTPSGGLIVVVSDGFTFRLGADAKPGMSDVIVTLPFGDRIVATDAFECLLPKPTAVITTNPDPASGPAPLTVNFDGSNSIPGLAEITWYSWDLGDGITAAGSQVSRVYTTPGTYQAHLMVSAADGESASTWTPVTVTKPAPDLTLSIDPASVSLYPGKAADFTATGSAADAGAVTWTVSPEVALTVAGNRATFTAPGLDEDHPAEFTLTATSTVDPSVSAQAEIRLLRYPLFINPNSANLAPGDVMTFSAFADEELAEDAEWTADAGSIEASGGVATYIAPETPGEYKLSFSTPRYPGLVATAIINVDESH